MRGRTEDEGRLNSWGTMLAYAWPALLLTVIALALLRCSRDPKIPCGDAVLVDLCLGLVAVGAFVFWLRVLAGTLY